MSGITANNTRLYEIPLERIRQHRQIFYKLDRLRDEDIEVWFNRVQRFVRRCKFARHWQFFVIDKFICELRAGEIERIKRAIDDSWSIHKLNKYFEDESNQKKRIELPDVGNKSVDENLKSPTKVIKCEIVSGFF